jgi:L-alanine-DL-glutamate epimerase-like enolase superfamily enzyme
VTAIERIEAFPLRYPEPNDANRDRYVTLARIETDDGAVGWGECISQWPESALAVKTIVERGLAPLLAGKDPTEVRRRWLEMRDHSFWIGMGGTVTFAVSAVDMALWDVAGKLAGVPVHRLLGGKLHDRVRACASMIWHPGDLEVTAAEFAECRDRGFTWIKGGWGRDPDTAFGLDPKRDVAVVAACREAVGEDVEISCDVSARANWTATHAIEMAKRFEPYRLAWLEDALHHEDHDGWRRLREAAPMHLATGERCWTVEDYRRLVRSDGVDIVLIDPGRAEGLTGMKLAADDAHNQHIRFVPHSWSSALNTAAALHVFASSPNGVVFELKPVPSPMQHELVRRPFEQVDGYIEVTDEAGLGVEVDEGVVRKYAFE